MEAPPSSPSAVVRQPLFYVLLGAAFYLCCNLFSWRGTPLLLGGDEQVFWMNALRMGQGELIYRDFFEFTPPGTDLVYRSAFSLFGPRIWVPNIVQLVLGTALTCLCFHIARSLLKPSAAALAAGLFLVLEYGAWLDATHHWFSLLAVVMAASVLLPGSSVPRVLLAGAFLGLASFFTQTRGVGAALGLTGFLLWEDIRADATSRAICRQQLRLWLAVVLTWLLLSSYFIIELGLAQLFYFQALYVLSYVTNEAHNLYPYEHHPLSWPLRRALIYFALPAIYAVSLWRARNTPQARAVALLACTGAGLFLEVAQSPNILRVDCVSFPAIILFVWLLSDLAARARATARMPVYAGAVVWICLIGLGAHQIWSRNVSRRDVVDLPAGRAAVLPAVGQKLTWLAQRTTPGELFFQASYQSLYLPLGLRNPAFDYLDRFTSPEFAALDLRQLAAKRVRYIVWSPLDRPRYPLFEQFLSTHYRQVQQFPDGDEVWELR